MGTFEIDSNGILNVGAEDKGTGKSEMTLRTLSMATSTQCVPQPRVQERTKVLARRWTMTKKKRSWMRSRMDNRGWTQTQRLTRRRSKRNTRRWKAFVRP